jgi:hypothetical protein
MLWYVCSFRCGMERGDLAIVHEMPGHLSVCLLAASHGPHRRAEGGPTQRFGSRRRLAVLTSIIIAISLQSSKYEA